MTSDRIEGTALRVPLFVGIGQKQLSALLQHAEKVTYHAGDTLIERGEMGDAAFLIVAGRATQINELSTLHPYEFLKPGTLVGEMAMLIETQHHLTVVADETVKAVKFSRAMVQDQMAKDPQLADHFVHRIAARLQDLAAEMRAYEAKRSAMPAHTNEPTPQDSANLSTTSAVAPPTWPIN